MIYQIMLKTQIEVPMLIFLQKKKIKIFYKYNLPNNIILLTNIIRVNSSNYYCFGSLKLINYFCNSKL